jgi:hypothetical protein
MNPINRIGQKVRCVGDERVWLLFVCPTLKVFPRNGVTYTVAGFEEHQGLPCIHLREIAGLECACKSLSGVPWLIAAFRPLDERETDIGELRALLVDEPEKVPA